MLSEYRVNGSVEYLETDQSINVERLCKMPLGMTVSRNRIPRRYS